jgi:MHS family proline/betaine transporter-like MFS transporter
MNNSPESVARSAAPTHEELSPEQRVALRKAAMASFIGNFVEWFDYASYGYFATIIAHVFFPDEDGSSALIKTYAVFAISFILRPIGGIVWGHLGDRRGRRWALSWSILLMSGATFCIGLLPSYAAIGLLAPLGLLVLRAIQGFSASGEYAGASAFLAEYAPKGKRGLYCSFVPASTSAGLLVGSLFAFGMHSWLTEADQQSWGWRIPFLLAGPLGIIGRYIRVHLEDSPVYRQMAAQTDLSHAKAPISELFSKHTKAFFIALGVASLNAVAFYLILSYMPVYLVDTLGIEQSTADTASTVSLFIYMLAIFVMGAISDRHGRKKMLVLASILFIVLTVPLFLLFKQPGLPVAMVIGITVVFSLILTVNDGTLPTFLAEIFPTQVRYSGFALSFNAANAFLGGTAPLVATSLIAATGNDAIPAWYLTMWAVLALIAMLMSKETAFLDLKDDRAVDSVVR